MKFSLLVPSRERTLEFTRFITSVEKMTRNKEDLEILIAVDNDDFYTQEYVQNIINKYLGVLDIQMFIRERTEMLNNDYYNWLASKAKGDYMWVLADDLEIVVPNWDIEVAQEITNFIVKYPDKIFCISIKDNTPPPSHRIPKFPCFPMLSREAIEATGWILFPKTPTWGADYITFCIFDPLDRILKLHNKNYLVHYSYHTKTAEIDKTNWRIGEIFNRLKMIPHFNTDRAIEMEVPGIRLDLLQKVKDWEEIHKPKIESVLIDDK